MGHAVLDADGVMLSADEGFCAIMHAPAEHLVGRSIVEITTPPDRAASIVGLSTLRETGAPFVVAKLMQRFDGSAVKVEQITAITTLDDRPRIIATFVPIVDTERRLGPGALLAQARFLRQSRIDRRDMLGTDIFSLPPWDLLLQLYIAEAESEPADLATVAQRGGVAPAVAVRWARAMASEGLLEIEALGHRDVATHYRLTARAQERLERYLSNRLHKLTRMAVIT